MKVFTCKDFAGHWPVGAAVVVVAFDEACALAMLRAKLESEFLPQGDRELTLVELPLDVAGVRVLVNGDY